MTLVNGTCLGVYEIRERLGAGGMGEVYRAYDPRLKRDVAVKVLADAPLPDRMARLQQEARVAGALNHPHIVTVFDIGVHDGHPFVVLELLKGETLRDRLRRETFRGEQLSIDIAVSIARGLAAAHEKGIVHRDLKPENVFLVDGRHVKLLDFGLAQPPTALRADSETTAYVRTNTGIVLGTAAYMSPEQARGAALDTRSDLFSLGILIYELLSGTNPFRRDTSIDSLAGILNEEPSPLVTVTPAISPALAAIVHRCLQKRLEDRFQSAADLAFALQNLGTATRIDGQPDAERRRSRVLPGIAAAIGVLAVAAAALWLLDRPYSDPPVFHQLSFRRGWVGSARFSPDSGTVIYSGAFDAEPPRVYTGRVDSRESRAMDMPPGLLLSVSASSELAVATGSTWLSGSWRKPATLAQVPLAGGAPRELENSISWADWSPDGKALAVVRQLPDGRQQLEYPIGHVIEVSDASNAYLRVDPSGDRIAYFAYAPFSNLGSLVIVDRAGSRRVIIDSLVWPAGLAWHPDGQRIWFAAGDGTGTSSVHEISLNGTDRIVYRTPGYLVLHDRSSDGRLLVSPDDTRVEAIARAPASHEERDISWLDVSNVADITNDGRRIAIVDLGVGAGSTIMSYLRGTDGSPAIRLSEGTVYALSPEGKRAIVFRSDSPPGFRIVPTGAGESIPLKASLPGNVASISWSPVGDQVIATAGREGEPTRCFVVDVDSGTTRPVTPPATSCARGAASPDGQFVLATDDHGALAVYPVAGGSVLPVRSVEPGEAALGWGADGRSIFVRERDGVPIRVTRIGLADGSRRPLTALGPRDVVGVTAINSVVLAADGSVYAYSFLRHLSTLFLVSGLN